VIRAARLAFPLGEQHRLHRLHVRADYFGERGDHDWVRESLAHQRRQLVREVDAGVPADDRIVRFAGRAGFQPLDGARLTADDAQRLGVQFRYLRGSEGGGQHGIPVAGVPVREVGSRRVVVSLRHETSLAVRTRA
jgi:hypothetical protein